jgi:hypothetical protein
MLAVTVLGAGAAHAQHSYASANEAYKKGDHAGAIRQYEALVTAGVTHEDLFYNLGNAYFRAGQLGRAIFNYERALRLDPGFEDARYNLHLARSAVAARVEDRIEGAEGQKWRDFADGTFETAVLRGADVLTVGTVAVLFLVFNVLFFAGLIAMRFLGAGFARTTIRVTNGFTGVALLLVTLLLVGHIYFLEKVNIGVVLPDALHLREGADRQSAERGVVHAGLRVRILRRDLGWIKVRLANGVEGWVERAAIGEL